jgi:transcriptional repressor NrdR
MRCPYCDFNETKVIDSRNSDRSIRRRRECESCGKRFTTYERAELVDLFVVKKDGRREPFDRQKLLAGIMRACEKRPVSHEKIEQMVDGIERELRGRESIEIRSKEIGGMVMKKLKRIDKVAYIRFASVYRSFEDVHEFEKELKKLLK